MDHVSPQQQYDAKHVVLINSGLHSRIYNSLLLIIIIVVCIGLIQLGNWQLHRLQWKTDLIQRVEQRITAAPIPAPINLSTAYITAEQHEYLRVTIRGEFLHDQETLVWAATEHGTGFWVLTPLRNDEITVLINRGFIPLESREKSSTNTGHTQGQQTITGLLRLTEPKGGLFRNNMPSQKRWYSRDVMAIAAEHDLKDIAPYFIDAEKQDIADGLPIAGLTQLSFRNNHLMYALTWYGLAILLVFMIIYALIKTHKD